MGTMAVLGLIFAVLGTVASVGTGLYANAQNQRIAERNFEEANKAREDNQQFMQEQQLSANNATIQMFNAMDSPAAKRAQLENAGMSVGLMYGGGGAGGSAHSSAMAAAPAGGAANVAPFLNPLLDITKTPTEAIKEMVESEKTKKEEKKVETEIDRTYAETRKIEEETKTEVVTRNYTATQTKIAELQLQFEAASYQTKLNILENERVMISENIRKTRAEIKRQNIDNKYAGKLYQSTLDLNNELRNKYIAEQTKTLADTALARAEEKLTNQKTETEKWNTQKVEQEVEKLKIIVGEYKTYGYKGTEADNWASEVIALCKYIAKATGLIKEEDPEEQFYDENGRDRRLKGTGIHGGGTTW